MNKMENRIIVKKAADVKEKCISGVKYILRKGMNREDGIDGILVTVGLCIIALLLCVVMKDSLAGFIETIVQAMTDKAKNILTGTTI